MFKIAKMRTLAERAIEVYAPTNDEAIVLGEALVLTSGKLTKCAATATPEYIARSAGTNKAIAVNRVLEEDIFETTFAADASAVNEGSKVTIHTDGLQVTATTTNGVFYITKKLGSGDTGTKVQGMFRR
jgi:hypothetical protein